MPKMWALHLDPRKCTQDTDDMELYLGGFRVQGLVLSV